MDKHNEQQIFRGTRFAQNPAARIIEVKKN
jgi:hypothetical protein